MDEMTEKQEEATRIIEAIGTTSLNECYVPVMRTLPCPFCGSDTEIETTTFGDSTTAYFRVNCKQKGHSLDWWSDTVDEAISVWNERRWKNLINYPNQISIILQNNIMKTIFEIINGNFILRKEYRDKVKDYLDGNMPTTESDKRFAAQSYLYGVLRSHGVVNPMSLAAMVVDSIVAFTKMNEQ